MAKPRKKKAKRGRPTKLTPAVREQICIAVQAGAPYNRAAQLCEIAPRTFQEWRTKGTRDIAEGNESTPEAELMLRVGEADARVTALLEGTVVQAAVRGRDWRAAVTYLERKKPEEWGRKDTVQVEVKQQMVTEFLQFLRGRVEADVYDAVLDALAPEASGGPPVLQLN